MSLQDALLWFFVGMGVSLVLYIPLGNICKYLFPDWKLLRLVLMLLAVVFTGFYLLIFGKSNIVVPCLMLLFGSVAGCAFASKIEEDSIRAAAPEFQSPQPEERPPGTHVDKRV